MRRSLACALLSVAATGSGCTLAKPVVGAVVGPVILLGGGGGGGGCGCDDGRAAAAVLFVFAGIGAGAGLVTGIISDVQALSGEAADPTANWWDPFATNTDPVR
ncbi:MAG: hypothetical protein JNK15_07560 [Planctomycetes bacterium]|nr:hypothetical protein [Planctomycetota bacterium]